MDVRCATSVILMIILQLSLHLSFVHNEDLHHHPANLKLQILHFTHLYKKKCSAGEIQLDLQTHVTLKVDLQINEKTTNLTREIVVIPEGMNETAARNTTCELYVASLRCSWEFGKHAPDDTNYTLLIIQDGLELQCQHYKTDKQRRTGKCEIHDLAINVEEKATILLEGHNKKDIQIYAQCFHPMSKEVFKPPTIIRTLRLENEVTIYWTKPQTNYTAGSDCFKYEMQDAHGKIKPVDFHDNYTYTKDISSFQEECPLRMRASGIWTCGMNTNWGEWSDELRCESHGSPVSVSNIIIYTAIATAVIMACVIILLLFMRSFKMLFPPIPHPRKYSLNLKPTNQENKLDNESLRCKQMIAVLESEEADVICLEN